MWLTNKERDALEKAVKMNEIMVEMIQAIVDQHGFDALGPLLGPRDVMKAKVGIKDINTNLRCVLDRDAAATEGL